MTWTWGLSISSSLKSLNWKRKKGSKFLVNKPPTFTWIIMDKKSQAVSSTRARLNHRWVCYSQVFSLLKLGDPSNCAWKLTIRAGTVVDLYLGFGWSIIEFFLDDLLVMFGDIEFFQHPTDPETTHNSEACVGWSMPHKSKVLQKWKTYV